MTAKYSVKMAASEVTSFKTNLFMIAGSSEAETSVSGKAECLLAIGEDKKSKLFGVPFALTLCVYIHISGVQHLAMQGPQTPDC